MLQTVTIQNFKSLRDVTVHLQKVNLLIGPNNSGKSNFLKALAFLKEHYNGRIQPGLVDFERLSFKHYYDQNIQSRQIEDNRNSNIGKEVYQIKYGFKWGILPIRGLLDYVDFYQLEFFGFNSRKQIAYNEGIGFSTKREGPPNALFKTNEKGFSLNNILYLNKEFNFFQILFWNNVSYLWGDLTEKEIAKIMEMPKASNVLCYSEDHVLDFFESNIPPGRFLSDTITDTQLEFSLTDLFNSIKIFRPDPSRITAENELFNYDHVNEDCSNLVAFLDNMRDRYDHIWLAIQKDLNKCLPDFVGINFDKVPINGKETSLGKRFGLRDKSGKTYWAEELSEGTIYFLALLAIVHQPDPPKVLLLEEPEKGIHPRRIAEVMDLIFKLAEEKDIQIIMTSHSTQVVDAFQDIPESVFVFDMEDGETKIKNLQTDIIEADTKDAKAKGFPPIDYSKRSLSEHWATGLLGGVPH